MLVVVVCWEQLLTLARSQSKLSGVIIVDAESDLSHAGVSLVAEGCVKPQLSSRSVGIFEAFYSSIKPMTVLRSDIEIQKPGRFPSGKTELPFELPVEALPGMVRVGAARCSAACVVLTAALHAETGGDLPWCVRDHHLHAHMHNAAPRVLQVTHFRARVHRRSASACGVGGAHYMIVAVLI